MKKRRRIRKFYKRETRYADLTNDKVFKYYFSTNKAVLLAFLKCFLPNIVKVESVRMLNKEEKKKFGGIIYLDTSKPPEAPGKKYIILDLLVQLENRELVHLEIQKYRQSYLPQRTTYCWARLYIKDLESGISYKDLKPVHSLVLTTFNVFGNKGNSFVHPQAIRSGIAPYEIFTEDLDIVMVEMNKVKNLRSFDLQAQWCYLIMNSANLPDWARRYLEQTEELKMALEHLDEVSENERLSWIEWERKRDLDWWKIERNALLKDGREEGMAKGKAEGMEQKQKEIALRMLETGYTSDEISKLTNLSEEEIGRLNGQLSARS